MNHWTQASAKDFAYNLSLDFFTQLEDRLEQSPMKQKDYAAKLGVSASRISQVLNSPPENPKLESLVQYAQALGLKVAVVAYDDGDPDNNKGPVISEVFTQCWERAQKPRDLSAMEGSVSLCAINSAYYLTAVDFYRPSYWGEETVAHVVQDRTASQTLMPIGILIGNERVA